MTDHTPMSKVSRFEVIQSHSRRRWSADEKRRIVVESGPRQVSETAQRYGLLPSQLFTWRRLAREGRLTGGEDTVTFAQAMIAHSPPPAALSASRMEMLKFVVGRLGFDQLYPARTEPLISAQSPYGSSCRGAGR